MYQGFHIKVQLLQKNWTPYTCFPNQLYWSGEIPILLLNYYTTGIAPYWWNKVTFPKTDVIFFKSVYGEEKILLTFIHIMTYKVTSFSGLTLKFVNFGSGLWSKNLKIAIKKICDNEISFYTRGKKEVHPYYISSIEMRSIWMEIK